MEAIFEGFSEYTKSLVWIFRSSLFKYVIKSALISLIVFFFIFGGAVWFLYDAIQDIIALFKAEDKQYLAILWEVLPFAIYSAAAIALFKNIVILANGPIFTQLSAATEQVLYPQNSLNSGKSLSFEIIRAVKMAIWSTLKEMLYTLPLFLLSFIPVVGIVFLVIMFVIQAYYVGIGYWDFVLERKGHDVKQSIVLVNQQKYWVTGVGLGFMLLMFIPVVGLFLAPSVAVVASTKIYLEKTKA